MPIQDLIGLRLGHLEVRADLDLGAVVIIGLPFNLEMLLTPEQAADLACRLVGAAMRIRKAQLNE